MVNDPQNVIEAVLNYRRAAPLTSVVRVDQLKLPPVPRWQHVLYPGTSEEAVLRLAADEPGSFVAPHDGYLTFLRFANGGYLFDKSLAFFGKGCIFEDEPSLPGGAPVCLSTMNSYKAALGYAPELTIIGCYPSTGDNLVIRFAVRPRPSGRGYKAHL